MWIIYIITFKYWPLDLLVVTIFFHVFVSLFFLPHKFELFDKLTLGCLDGKLWILESLLSSHYYIDAHLGLPQRSNMEQFATTVNDF